VSAAYSIIAGSNIARPKIAGLILAAGESRRMGSPKALLPYQGATFLDTLIALFSARCSTVIVVVGAGAETIRRAIHRDAEFVYNRDYLSGQTSSLQAGLRAIPSSAEGVLFTLVDHPSVSGETIDRLLAPPFPLVRIPRFEGERGHPALFRRDLFPEFLSLPPDGAANQVVRSHRAETEFLDVSDPGVIADIDDPAGYQELLASSTRGRA
jgi:molybdenum cofactor cytidylyltransferase